MKTADLEAEMHRALANLGPDLFAELVGAGVPPLAIVDLMVGVELIDYTGDGLYFPDPAGKRAFITPVRVQFPNSPQSTDPSAFVRMGDLIDLIAWNIGDCDCGALRVGCAAWLGCTEVQDYPDLVKPGPTRLWRTILDWFRANLEGRSSPRPSLPNNIGFWRSYMGVSRSRTRHTNASSTGSCGAPGRHHGCVLRQFDIAATVSREVRPRCRARTVKSRSSYHQHS